MKNKSDGRKIEQKMDGERELLNSYLMRPICNFHIGLEAQAKAIFSTVMLVEVLLADSLTLAALTASLLPN